MPHQAIHHPLPKFLVGISTKTYFSHAKTIDYLKSLTSTFPGSHADLGLFFIPTAISLVPCAEMLQAANSSIYLGAQHCDTEAAGPHTGSLPASLLGEVGCSLVELGHAERRIAPYNESNELISAKVSAVIEQGLIPLVCIGETSQSTGPASEAVGKAIEEVSKQILPVLDAGSFGSGRPVIFAYEPVWAIGADAPAGPDHVCAVVAGLKQVIANHAQTQDTEFRILYGGAAGPGTWTALKDHIDGLFLGRFAHDISNVQSVVGEVLGSER